MKTLEVVAAIIVKNSEFLCMQRNKSKFSYISEKFEFPGGKIEKNELKHEALMRELKEEMDIDIIIGENDYFMTVDHLYPDFRIVMYSYLCQVNSLEFKLNDHMGYKWLPREELSSLDWAPADLPIVEKLIKEE